MRRMVLAAVLLLLAGPAAAAEPPAGQVEPGEIEAAQRLQDVVSDMAALDRA